MTEDRMRPQDYLQLSSVYALLSRLWQSEVDMPTLEALNESDMRSAYESMGGKVPEANEKSLEELAVDYCQLLIGPQNAISPVQSIWEENKFQGQASVSMKKYLDALPTFHTDEKVVDHIGVQLAFMAELFVQASTAEHPEAYEDIATGFIAEHIAWTEEFFERVEARAETDFYKGLARLSQDFLAFEFAE